MCGLSGYFARNSIGTSRVLSDLFKEGSRRGSDGFGWVRYSPNQQFEYKKYIGSPDYNNVLNDIKGDKSYHVGVGEILISNNRAAPETESEVDKNKLNETVQPIVLQEEGLCLVHNGAVSNFIVNELKKEYTFTTDIDSEAILWAYIKHGRDIVNTMEYLSGGFAIIMIDSIKKKMYTVCSHNPLWCGYVKGYGLFYSSTEEGVFNTISNLKGYTINKNTLNIWEDYYAHRLPEYSIQEIDIDSGMVNDFRFKPRYVTSTYDPYDKVEDSNESLVLVSSSGGLDSSTTLTTLKSAGMNPIAVHFQYGHRGEEAELISIKKICEILDIKLHVFNISENMKQLDGGMLTDKNAEIITGTSEGLKTTAAWTVYRNHLFLTYMAALAESYIMKHNFKVVYLTGGFMSLTESACYPDNTERFIDAGLKFFKFSITGTRLKPLYGLCNILKTEQYVLLDRLGYLTLLSPWLISCDRPIVKENEEGILCGHNCCKDGKPACGSGLLSWWASKIAGVNDNRRWYEVNDPTYKAYEPNTKYNTKDINISKIINKLKIPEKNIEILKKRLGE